MKIQEQQRYTYYNINMLSELHQIKPTIINNDKHKLNTNITNNNNTNYNTTNNNKQC